MECELQSKAPAELEPTKYLTQSAFWAQVKKDQGYQPLSFELRVSKKLLDPSKEADIKQSCDLLILLKNLPNGKCFAYAPYGPKLEPQFEQQGAFLEELAENLKSKLPPNCLFIRFDLMWENQWSREAEYYDENGEWLGPPSPAVQEYRLNFKTTHGLLKKSISDALPKNTFFIDLEKSEEQLLAEMRYNTRYNIRKAQKNGIQVLEGTQADIHRWYLLYDETALRQQMNIADQDFFNSLLEKQAPEKNAVRVKLLLAKKEQEDLAAMFLVMSKDRAHYLYGASKSGKQNKMASYALQWHSIKTAKNLGLKEYDMFGSAPNLNKQHPLHGVHVYKKGFGGNLFHRMGCWDYPIDTKGYLSYRNFEMQREN
ncbi:MAG: lipid II:glycine glycyltransferase FemX [Luteibaculum sp.]